MDWNTVSAALSERLDSKHVKARKLKLNIPGVVEQRTDRRAY